MGLLSSWATPATSWPTEAIFSRWMSCIWVACRSRYAAAQLLVGGAELLGAHAHLVLQAAGSSSMVWKLSARSMARATWLATAASSSMSPSVKRPARRDVTPSTPNTCALDPERHRRGARCRGARDGPGLMGSSCVVHVVDHERARPVTATRPHSRSCSVVERELDAARNRVRRRPPRRPVAAQHARARGPRRRVGAPGTPCRGPGGRAPARRSSRDRASR